MQGHEKLGNARGDIPVSKTSTPSWVFRQSLLSRGKDSDWDIKRAAEDQSYFGQGAQGVLFTLSSVLLVNRLGSQCLVLCRRTSCKRTSQIVKLPISKACLKGRLLTEPPTRYHRDFAPQEVDGIRYTRSVERPLEDDLLGLGDLELLVTQGKAQSILQDPTKSRSQHVVTWPLRHWKVNRGVAAILERE